MAGSHHSRTYSKCTPAGWSSSRSIQKQTLSHPSYSMRIMAPIPQTPWFKKPCFSLEELSSGTFLSGEKFLLESKANDIKGAESDRLQQFGFLPFTLETSMSTGQTEPWGPKDAAPNSTTSCVNLEGGTMWGVSESELLGNACLLTVTRLSLLGARKWGGNWADTKGENK